MQEMGEWHGHIRQMNGVNLIELGMQGPMYSVWWHLSDADEKM